MSIEMAPTGQIVTRDCELKVRNVCLYPNSSGPVFLYRDENNRLWSVCKTCAEKQFTDKTWYRAGEVTSTSKNVSDLVLLRDRYLTLGDVIKSNIENLFKQEGMAIHSISFRVKSEDSIRMKLRRRNNSITQLKDLNDILGIRVVTIFADDIHAADDIIKRSFVVVDESVPHSDQTKTRSYVVKLPAKTEIENSMADYRAEIQIRSLLQDTLAVLEYHLQYKNKSSQPSLIRQRLGRVASLLELADEEISKIKEDSIN